MEKETRTLRLIMTTEFIEDCFEGKVDTQELGREIFAAILRERNTISLERADDE